MRFMQHQHIEEFLVLVNVAAVLSTFSRPRGVSIAKSALYEFDDYFVCFDGSATINFENINDNYCDCADGSDEPGTAACPNGTFDCNNVGFEPTSILSSRVNNGICDCCDGSDEYELHTHCINRCFLLAKQLREEQMQVYHQHLHQYELYKEYCRRGQELKSEQQKKIELLSKDKENLEQLKLQLISLKKSASEQLQSYLDSNDDDFNVNDASTQTTDVHSTDLFSVEKDDASKADETVLLESDNEHSTLSVLPNNPDATLPPIESIKQQETYSPQQLNDNEILRTETVDKHVLELTTAVKHSQQQLDDVEVKLNQVVSQIQGVQNALKMDFGAAGEFAVLSTECFEYNDSSSIYSLCPFDNITKHGQTQSTSVVLGTWSGWSDDSDKYTFMTFQNGDVCSNHLHWSAKVQMECGTKNAVVTVNESTTCRYLLTMMSPAACNKQPPAISNTNLVYDEL